MSSLSVPAPVSTSQGDAGCSQEAESSQSDITAPLKTKDRSPDIEIVDEKTEKDSCFEESLNLIRLMEDRLANKHCERMENKEGAPTEEGTEMISTSLKKSLFSAIKKGNVNINIIQYTIINSTKKFGLNISIRKISPCLLDTSYD